MELLRPLEAEARLDSEGEPEIEAALGVDLARDRAQLGIPLAWEERGWGDRGALEVELAEIDRYATESDINLWARSSAT